MKRCRIAISLSVSFFMVLSSASGSLAATTNRENVSVSSSYIEYMFTGDSGLRQEVHPEGTDDATFFLRLEREYVSDGVKAYYNILESELTVRNDQDEPLIVEGVEYSIKTRRGVEIGRGVTSALNTASFISAKPKNNFLGNLLLAGQEKTYKVGLRPTVQPGNIPSEWVGKTHPDEPALAPEVAILAFDRVITGKSIDYKKLQQFCIEVAGIKDEYFNNKLDLETAFDKYRDEYFLSDISRIVVNNPSLNRYILVVTLLSFIPRTYYREAGIAREMTDILFSYEKMVEELEAIQGNAASLRAKFENTYVEPFGINEKMAIYPAYFSNIQKARDYLYVRQLYEESKARPQASLARLLAISKNSPFFGLAQRYSSAIRQEIATKVRANKRLEQELERQRREVQLKLQQEAETQRAAEQAFRATLSVDQLATLERKGKPELITTNIRKGDSKIVLWWYQDGYVAFQDGTRLEEQETSRPPGAN